MSEEFIGAAALTSRYVGAFVLLTARKLRLRWRNEGGSNRDARNREADLASAIPQAGRRDARSRCRCGCVRVQRECGRPQLLPQQLQVMFGPAGAEVLRLLGDRRVVLRLHGLRAELLQRAMLRRT